MVGRYEHAYVHLPFCEVICHYCDFYTARAKGARYDEFFEALEKEARQAMPNLAPRLKALYFGGGTPSAAPAGKVAAFLELFRSRIGPETEVTLEANPVDVNEPNLALWKSSGVNRLSLGIQSLDDPTLKRLGRVHSADQALRALRLAGECLGNVSGDLIYGVPEQDVSTPARHARLLAEAGATHISAYHLSILPTHFLHPRLPDDQHAWSQIEGISQALAQAGFAHYEISNFGKPGFFSRNNGNYWRGGPYWALGPSAHGFDGEEKRWKNVSDWEEYIKRCASGLSLRDEEELLTAEQRMMEVLFTSLRTQEGLDLQAFQAKFGHDLLTRHASLWALWEKEGFGTLAKGCFIPSFSGRMLADSLVQKLL
jgi:oxygen-independent coproporphyrinogen-3 oxidase